MKSSRFYQNWLQIIMSISILLLFFSGFFFSKEEMKASFLFLVFNLSCGYLSSDLKYKRYQAIVGEYRKNIAKKLKYSKFYQRWLQIAGRGKDIVVFFIGLFLGKGYFALSVFLLCFQLANRIIMSELAYRREQAVLSDKKD